MAHGKTHLLRLLHHAYQKAVLQVKDEKPEVVLPVTSPISRKQFIGAAAMAGVAMGLGPLNAFGQNADEDELPVAIIGAGLAGLHAAHIFRKAGLPYKIYEASNRTGGRVSTATNMFGPGITTELGAEFIDSTHTDVLKLIDEFGISKVDFKQDADESKLKQAYFFEGKHFTSEEVADALKKFVPLIQADKKNVIGKDKKTLKKLDAMGIDAYLQGLGVSGWLYKLLTTAFVTEFGLEAAEQSALNFVNTIGFDADTPIANSDNRYRITGGNEVLASKLSEFIPENLEKDHKLVSIAMQGKQYLLKFENGKTVTANYVLLAIPFSVLRKVDIQVKLPAKKRKAIAELGYGTNSKIFAGFADRTWRKKGYTGYTINEVIQTGWDSSQMQNANAGQGGFTFYLGGDAGNNVGSGVEEKYLAELYKIYPGALQDYTGQSFVFNWGKNDKVLGSYACYKKGQWLAFAGSEFEPAGNLHFAGEHCSAQFPRTMNGALETGRRAAFDIGEKMRGKQKPK